MASLNEGRVPFFEADLDPLVTDGICDGLLSFHADNGRGRGGAHRPPYQDGSQASADFNVIDGALHDLAPWWLGDQLRCRSLAGARGELWPRLEIT